MNLTPTSDLKSINQHLEGLNPAEVITYAVGNYFNRKRIVASSSFQSQSLVLLYLLSKIYPQVRVLFLDTKQHFKETLSYVDQLRYKLGISIEIHSPLNNVDPFLYRENPDMCCYLSKVEPLQRRLKQAELWISGIRRDQTENRKYTDILSYDINNKVFKLSPLANLTEIDANNFIKKIGLPLHPLHSKGYLSIGCAPCTNLPTCGDPRSGRWQGATKTECGLHR